MLIQYQKKDSPLRRSGDDNNIVQLLLAILTVFIRARHSGQGFTARFSD